MNKTNKKVVILSCIANAFEWYDYALFGYFAPLIGSKFFPSEDLSTSLLNVFLVFAVGFFMRPVGGCLFGILGDRLGRRFALSLSIILMSIPTAAIGLLPTYEEIGIYSSVIMVIIRILQGLSIGGTLSGSISFVLEHTAPKRKGLLGSILVASTCIGILLASFVSVVLKITLSQEALTNWGWRIPFLIGVLVVFVGTHIKKCTQESPIFQAAKKDNKLTCSPLHRVLSRYFKNILVSVGINMTSSVLFYFQAVYMVTYLEVFKGFSSKSTDVLMNSSYLIIIVVSIFSGWISDIIGRKRLLLTVISVTILINFAITKTLISDNFLVVAMGHGILSLLVGFYIGPEPTLHAEFYPAHIRSTALAIAYNLGSSLFGGTAPYIFTYLMKKYQSPIVFSYYITVCGIISLISLYFYKTKAMTLNKKKRSMHGINKAQAVM